MPDWRQRNRILITCARGAVQALKGELLGLGYRVAGESDSSVISEGSLYDGMRMNLWLRAAHRVHWHLGELEAALPDDFYRAIRRLPWETWISPDEYLTVSSIVHNSAIRDFRFANQKCKDAICDRLRSVYGRRPDSGPQMKGASVFIYWENQRVSVYLDTTGEALSKRGYRVRTVCAPMQETLAAAVILTAGWTGAEHFVNPMCGSGTLAIEAALAASGRAPARLRADFAFMHLRGYDPRVWTALRSEADALIREPAGIRIIASDHDPGALSAARENARAAGVEDLVEFVECDFADTPMPDGVGVIVLNPEYGRRMGETQSLIPVYRCIGDYLKRCGPSWRGYVFTGNAKLFNKVSLRPDRQWVFYSGGTECRLLEFRIYAGKAPPAERSDLLESAEKEDRK